MRSNFVVILALFLFQSLVFADQMQDDWSGGPGVQGPVDEWADTFFAGDSVDWSTSSQISLQNSSIPSSFSYIESILLEDQNGLHIFCVADFDGDGDLDVPVAEYYGQNLFLLINEDGTGTNWTKHPLKANYNGVNSGYAADINGDGVEDLLTSARYNSNVVWFENNGNPSQWIEHLITSLNLCGSAIPVDIDSDGDFDVLLPRIYSAGGVYLFENTNGAGTAWASWTVDDNMYYPANLNTGDIDCDGDMDIVASNWASEISDNYICWWENTDEIGHSWIKHVIDDQIENYIPTLGDIDLDGDLDILSTEPMTDRVIWFENGGAGAIWIEHIITLEYDNARSGAIIDYDYDGDMDVVAAAGFDSNISWFENADSIGTTWVQHYIVQFTNNRPIDIVIGDLNGDDIEDIIAAVYDDSTSSNGDVLSWLRTVDSYQYASEGSVISSILDLNMSPGMEVNWGWFNIESEEPPGTEILTRVRSSADTLNMGIWSPWLPSGSSIETYCESNEGYFQYEVNLNTNDCLITPVLNQFSVAYSFQNGIVEGNQLPLSTPWLTPLNHPSRGAFTTIAFNTPAAGNVCINIHDLSGRIVRTAVNEEYPSGIHQFTISNLISGIYFVRMETEEYNITVKLIVLY